MKLSDLTGLKKNVPIILGGEINGLGMVRSFGEEGIPSIVVDSFKTIAFSSRYACGAICPDPTDNEKDFIHFLHQFGISLMSKGFLIATSDRYLIPVSRYQYLLDKHFIFPMSKWPIIENLINKTKLYTLAEEKGIPHPKTFILNSIHDLNGILDKINFPLIIKPVITIGFKKAIGKKALIVKSLIELEVYRHRIINSEFSKKSIIVQEYIPGGMEALYTITSYANSESDIIGYSIGHKIRQSPPETGTIISGKVTHVDQILQLGKKLIKESGYYGISNIEFKKDSRDGSYKLMEINPRSGVWSYSATACGVNIPVLAYKDLLNQKVRFTENKNRELIWYISILDLYLSLFGFKRMGHKKYSLSLSKWLSSIKGNKVDAVFSAKDIIPFLHYLLSFPRNVLAKKTKKMKISIH